MSIEETVSGLLARLLRYRSGESGAATECGRTAATTGGANTGRYSGGSQNQSNPTQSSDRHSEAQSANVDTTTTNYGRETHDHTQPTYCTTSVERPQAAAETFASRRYRSGGIVPPSPPNQDTISARLSGGWAGVDFAAREERAVTEYYGLNVGGDRDANTIMVSVIDAFVRQGARDLISNIEVGLDYRRGAYTCAVTTRFSGGEQIGTAVAIGRDMLERSTTHHDTAEMFLSLTERMIDDIRGRIASHIANTTEIRRVAPSTTRVNRSIHGPDYIAAPFETWRTAEADASDIEYLQQRAAVDALVGKMKAHDNYTKPKEKAKVVVTRKLRIRKLQSDAKNG